MRRQSEIAKSHNVPFKPNPELAIRDPDFFFSIDPSLKTSIDSASYHFNNDDEKKGGSGGPGGYGGHVAPSCVCYSFLFYLKFHF